MSEEKSAKYFSDLLESIKHTRPPAKPVLPHKKKPESFRKYADKLEAYEAESLVWKRENIAAAKRRSEIVDEFKDWTLEHCGIKDHPKAEKAWGKAFTQAHKAGFYEVFWELKELSELMKG